MYSSDNVPRTSAQNATSRAASDDQPSSFEANEEFRIFHRLINIPDGSDIVFKFSAAEAVNIMERKINLWPGGREYLVLLGIGAAATYGHFIIQWSKA